MTYPTEQDLIGGFLGPDAVQTILGDTLYPDPENPLRKTLPRTLAYQYDSPDPGTAVVKKDELEKARLARQARYDEVNAFIAAQPDPQNWEFDGKGNLYHYESSSGGGGGSGDFDLAGEGDSSASEDKAPKKVKVTDGMGAELALGFKQADSEYARLNEILSSGGYESMTGSGGGGSGGGGGGGVPREIDAAAEYLKTEKLKTNEIERQFDDFVNRADAYYDTLGAEMDYNYGVDDQNAQNWDARQSGAAGGRVYGHLPQDGMLSGLIRQSLPDYVRPDYRLNGAVGLPGEQGFDDPDYDENGFPLYAQGTANDMQAQVLAGVDLRGVPPDLLPLIGKPSIPVAPPRPGMPRGPEVQR